MCDSQIYILQAPHSKLKRDPNNLILRFGRNHYQPFTEPASEHSTADRSTRNFHSPHKAKGPSPAQVIAHNLESYIVVATSPAHSRHNNTGYS